MRVAIVRHRPIPPERPPHAVGDAAALAAVETSRWLRDAGLRPGLLVRAGERGFADLAGRLLAAFDEFLPTVIEAGLPSRPALWTRSLAFARRRMDKERRLGRMPEGAGDDVVYLLTTATVGALGPMLAGGDASVPPGNHGAAWILADVVGGWAVECAWPGRPPGELAPMPARPVRTRRDPALGAPDGRARTDRPWEEYAPLDDDALDRGTEPLLDGHGQQLPPRPPVGMRIDAQWGNNAGLFCRWEVVEAEAQSFTVDRASGPRRTFPTGDWPAWLGRRLREGVVTVHLPGCDVEACYGCDGAKAADRVPG